MKRLLILSLILFSFGCQGGDRVNYNITGPEEVKEGSAVAISVNGDAEGRGRYSKTTNTTTTKIDIKNKNVGNQQGR